MYDSLAYAIIIFLAMVLMIVIIIFYKPLKSKLDAFEQVILAQSEQDSYYNKELELALSEGRAYIITPKYFLIPTRFKLLIIFVFMVGFFFGGYKVFVYLDIQAQTCTPVFTLNAFYLKDITLIVLSIMTSYYFIVNSWLWKPKYTKPVDKLAQKNLTQYRFKNKIIYQDRVVNYKPTSGMVLPYDLLVLMMTIALWLPAFDLPVYQLGNANAEYEQRCYEKAYPFDKNK